MFLKIYSTALFSRKKGSLQRVVSVNSVNLNKRIQKFLKDHDLLFSSLFNSNITIIEENEKDFYMKMI
jgi:hypothetical protein